MTEPASLVVEPASAAVDPAVDRRLARLHLRMGQLGLARAALEALAGSGDLDDDGLLALAEARWRTGDLTGAGDAAQAYLEAGGEDTVAVVIAAEAVAAVGRPGEARRLAERVLARGDVDLDPVFAGAPRSQIWPSDPADAGQPAGTLFGTDARGTRLRRTSPVEAAAPAQAAAPSSGADARRGEPGLWDAAEAVHTDVPAVADQLAIAREELEGGSVAEAAVRLALALRVAPELAPAIVEVTDQPGHRTPQLEIVRGDALRALGHELDASRAYAAAAAAFHGERAPDTTATEPQPEPQPEETS